MAVTWIRKSENLNIRIDARTRCGLDLLARVSNRSVSEIVLAELRKRLDAELPRRDVDGKQVSLLDVVWDVFEQDRMVKLAVFGPELLTEDEQKMWRVISEDRAYIPKRGTPNYAAIRKDWKTIQSKVREYEESAKE
jgi:hypothetical protein